MRWRLQDFRDQFRAGVCGLGFREASERGV